MPPRKNGINKSEEIRQILKAHPGIAVREVVDKMASRGLPVTDNLVYFLKGKMRGRRGRRKRARQMVARVAATGSSDPVAMVLKIKSWANELGGMKKLKALVDALSE